MKTSALFSVIAVCVLLVKSHPHYDPDEEFAFREFKAEYKRHYVEPGEEPVRKAIFIEHLREIHRHNLLYSRGLSTWQMGINNFTDRLPIELPLGLHKHWFNEEEPKEEKN